MRLSFCVEMLWPGLPTQQAMRQAHSQGARAIEFWGWWNKDLDAIRQVSAQHNLAIAAICTPFYSLVDEREHDAWLKGLADTIQAAQQLNCSTIISQVGYALADKSREEQHEAMVKGLRLAVPMLSQSKAMLVIEPLNTVTDHKGYYLTSSDEAAQVLQEVNHPQVKMLFDIYHQALMGEDVLAKIGDHLPLIGHMHCAGVPGRGPLNTGALDYNELFREIDALHYDGFVGVELRTDKPEDEVGAWVNKFPQT